MNGIGLAYPQVILPVVLSMPYMFLYGSSHTKTHAFKTSSSRARSMESFWNQGLVDFLFSRLFLQPWRFAGKLKLLCGQQKWWWLVSHGCFSWLGRSTMGEPTDLPVRTGWAGSCQQKASLATQSCLFFPREGFNKIPLLPFLAQCHNAHTNLINLRLQPFSPDCSEVWKSLGRDWEADG